MEQLREVRRSIESLVARVRCEMPETVEVTGKLHRNIIVEVKFRQPAAPS